MLWWKRHDTLPSSDGEPKKASSGEDSKQMSGLVPIIGCDNASRSGDVIFVHGLGGHAWSTWHPQERHDDRDFWPVWLGEERSDLGIWSFGYKAEPFEWKGTTMPLFDRAGNLLKFLEVYEIGERPLIFITHSMGGLLVKEMLRSAQTYGKTAIIEQTKGIVFLSTPHTGSHLAHLIDNIGFLARTTVSVEELKPHIPQLRQLTDWYQKNVDELGIDTEVYYETQTVRGILVVDPVSANPGIKSADVTATDDDHISISKPGRKSIVYLGTKKFIKKHLKPPLQLPASVLDERNELQENYKLLSGKIQRLRNSEKTDNLVHKERFSRLVEIEESEAELEQLCKQIKALDDSQNGHTL